MLKQIIGPAGNRLADGYLNKVQIGTLNFGRQVGTNMALSAQTRIRQKALADSAFDLRSGRT